MEGFFNPFVGGAGGSDDVDYNNLTNKPTINGVTVQGSLTTGDLLITAEDIGALPSETKYGADFTLSVDSQTFVIIAQLKDQDGNNLGQAKTIDLPLETMVVDGRYDDTTQKIILTLKNGQTVEFSVADLVNGLQSEITLNNKLDADLVSDTNSENKFVTITEKSAWNGKQDALTFDSVPTVDSTNPITSSGVYIALAGKQDTISDLSAIRSGAAAGATAVQPTEFQNAVQEFQTGISDEIAAREVADSELMDEINQLKNYTGYEESQTLGLQVDYQNKTFARLGKAVDLTPGSSFNQFNIYNKRRRCNVSDDGTINAFYGESGYIEDGTNGQVMVYQPKFYYKVEPLKLEPIVDGEGYHIRKANYYISETPRNGFKLHPAFKDENGNELEYYLIGAYEASLYDVSASTYILDDAQVADFSADKICSIANAKPMSGETQNLTRSNCEKLATNRGTRWHNMTIQIASAEQLLFMIEYGKMNAQETIGKGVVNKASGSGNEAVNTGLTSDFGNASGAASGTDGLVSITYRGVENLWGNIWNWIDGVNIWGDGTKKSGIPYITDKLPFVENTKTNYNSAGFTTSGTNGYISAMGYGNPDYDWIFFASETIGNSTLPVGDYQYYTANLNGYKVAQLGNYWYFGLSAGLFCWNLNDSSSYRSRTIGGRGVIIPDINATNYWTNIHKTN